MKTVSGIEYRHIALLQVATELPKTLVNIYNWIQFGTYKKIQ